MAKRKKKSSPAGPRLLLLLFGIAALLFLAGEAWRWLRSDSGALALSGTFGWTDRARVTQILSRHVRRGLASVNVPRDSVRESVGTGRTAVRWRVGLAPEASLMQANHAISEAVRRAGGRVFTGRERNLGRGATEVTLELGIGRERTHAVVLTRGVRPEAKTEEHPARVALVLFGFSEDEALAKKLFALERPFAVAIPPDGKGSVALFRAAHRAGREVVLHVPLEPINYPQVNPGPGTLLVTMKPAKIATELRRQIGQGRPVVAVANLMGSLATQDMTMMTAFYEELRRARLPFVHLTPVPGAVCKPLASQLGVSYDEPDEVFDTEPREAKPAVLDKRWRAFLKDLPPGAQRVVWVRATPTSLQWLDHSLDPRRLKGVDLVPVTALMKRPPSL